MKVRNGLLIGIASFLTACGGGGTHVASTPPAPTAPPPPPPPPPAAVTIFANPVPGEYVSVGTSASGSGGYESTRNPIGTISANDEDQPHVRYSSGGFYEVRLPAAAYDRLIPYGEGTADSVLTTATSPRSVQLTISNSRNDGFRYSELAFWTSNPSHRYGVFAFGVPTPQGAVPVTGSATYSGKVFGETDIYEFDYLAGAYFRDSVQGDVTLNFDFGQGSLAGEMSLSLHGYGPIASLGTFNFRDTVFSSGSTTYSGRFDTTAQGQNFFLGRFTGPAAQETIGAWALPFVFQGDGQNHQSFGAWIAKRP